MQQVMLNAGNWVWAKNGYGDSIGLVEMLFRGEKIMNYYLAQIGH
jgi:hypothetical protein